LSRSSPASRTSAIAAPMLACAITSFSSLARSSGIVSTAMQPALIVPNQSAAVVALL